MQLSSDPTLSELQEYIAQKARERGFADESVQDKFMLLVEEIGELAKAMRPMHGVKVADDSSLTEVEHELADVLLLTMNLASKLDIAMADALHAKEAKNQKRNWQ